MYWSRALTVHLDVVLQLCVPLSITCTDLRKDDYAGDA